MSMNPNFSNGDIVRFNNADTEAGKFCEKHQITGRINTIKGNICTVDTGFGYTIYENISNILLVAMFTDIPTFEEVE